MHTNLRKDQLPILYANLIAIVLFTFIFAWRKDYEFLLYILVVIVAILFINTTNRLAHYSNALSWTLSIWTWMHLAGSALRFDGLKLYEILLVPVSRNLGLIRYDHVVHALGMAAVTLALFQIFQAILSEKTFKNWNALALLLVATSLGIGAGNEIIEFIVTLSIPENGVGDYTNSSLDHLANLAGTFAALIYVRTNHLRNRAETPVQNR